MEKRVLGRGLGALIPEKTKGKQQETSNKANLIKTIPIEKIRANKYQPRTDFDKKTLDDLADSIKEKGLIQPVIVRSIDDGYELIAGERRFRASQLVGLKELPAIVKEASDVDSLEISIIENVQRENLNPIDQAKAYNRLIGEFEMTQENVASAVGKDRATIANILRLLKLPEKIQEHVSRGTISMGHARAMLSIDNQTEQLRLCTKVIKKDLSVRETERYAKKEIQNKKNKKTATKDPNIESIEEKLRDILGTRVRITKNKKGGKIEVEFYSDNELEKFITYLKSIR